MTRSHAGVVALLSLVLLRPVSSPAQTPNDQELMQRRNDLLVTYEAFKTYPTKDPKAIYAKLSEDRQAVFDALVRALFVPISEHRLDVEAVATRLKGVAGTPESLIVTLWSDEGGGGTEWRLIGVELPHVR
jgi:hypothetical protein